VCRTGNKDCGLLAARAASPKRLIDHLGSIDKRRIRRVFDELALEDVAAIDQRLAGVMSGCATGSVTGS
jgi:hypothetical protein